MHCFHCSADDLDDFGDLEDEIESFASPGWPAGTAFPEEIDNGGSMFHRRRSSEHSVGGPKEIEEE